MEQYTDKVAIITGGSAGIGRALCEELAHQGAIVYIADINEDEGQKLRLQIVKKGYNVHFVQVDVSDKTAVQRLIDIVMQDNGHIDYMFNNAGIAIGGDARDLSLDQWHRVLNVNLSGVLYGTTLVYKIMAKQGYGHIINTASATGLLPQPGNAPYCASKHAVIGMSLSLRAEGADLGVRVSTICPGRVQTDIFKSSSVVNMSQQYSTDNIATKAMDVTEAVRIILDGVSHNRAIIIFPFSVRIAWYLNRLFPRMMESVWIKRMRNLRQYRMME